MLLSDIILETSEAALQIQLDDGSFPPGHNGPYHDQETPIRNTAHWLITLLKAYEISNNAKFKDSAWKAAQFLLLPSGRPMNATFFCRDNPEKDFCNGLIGQAWVIEALAIAGVTLEDSRYHDLARKIFLLHPFDHKVGLWRRVNVDGSYHTYDIAFNHQLWFAAAGVILNSNANIPIDLEIKRFLDQTRESHLQVDDSGRIIHSISLPKPLSKRNRIRKFLRRQSIVLKKINQTGYKDDRLVSKEIGYHAFNMYAFALLKQCIPNEPLWKSAKFLSALNFMNKSEFVHGLEDNIYGYPYNPPGFEVTFTIQEFSSFTSFSKPSEWWVAQQLSRCYDKDKKMMSRSTEDEKTHAARLYEATRLTDLEFRI